ncbi:hypothetical protein HY310_00605 [Candidatus Microgenomates bacterium]|nr:hypothetical protein [Candidatus Microgenomates bacterium]
MFRTSLKAAEKLIKQDGDRIIFIGQKPRFASQNLGYIEFGSQTDEVNNLPLYAFKSFKYRPHLSTAEKWVKDGHHSWNLGYFVTTPRFLWKLFEQFAPALFAQLKQISDVVDTPEYDKVLHEIYPQVEKISFDNAVLENMDPSYGSVISVDLGWSDIGAWEALKEALEKNEADNVVKGNALVEDSQDSLIFNFTKQLVVGIDLEEMVVVNTDDVVLVCPKSSVPKIKDIVASLQGTPNEHLV